MKIKQKNQVIIDTNTSSSMLYLAETINIYNFQKRYLITKIQNFKNFDNIKNINNNNIPVALRLLTNKISFTFK